MDALGDAAVQPQDSAGQAPATAESGGAGEGQPVTDGDRIAALELENLRLRRILADRDLEIEMLTELSRGTY